MEQLLGILVVVAVMLLFLMQSQFRFRQIQPLLDEFATAFCEAADRVLQGKIITDALAVQPREGGGMALLPLAEQPEAIQALFQHGVDEYMMERLRRMYALREKAQRHQPAINFYGKKVNGVLNRCYDLTNMVFSILNDPSLALSEKDVKEFEFYLVKQRFLRTTTLAAIVSETCREKIAAQ